MQHVASSRWKTTDAEIDLPPPTPPSLLPAPVPFRISELSKFLTFQPGAGRKIAFRGSFLMRKVTAGQEVKNEAWIGRQGL